MKNEKKVFIVKKEFLFPEINGLKKINELWWKFILNFFVMRTIRKYKKSELLVITDPKTIEELKKENCNILPFDNYIKIEKPHNDPYIEAIMLTRKLFKNLEPFLEFEGDNLGEISEEEFAYNILPYIDEAKLIKNIVEMEKPSKLIVINKKSSFVKNIPVNLEIKETFVLSSQIYNLKQQLRRNSLKLRNIFYFLFNNREFKKTNNKIDKGKNILFAVFDSTDLKRINPLIQLATRKGRKFSILANYKDTQDTLANRKLKFVSFGDFLTEEDEKKAEEKRKFLIEKWGIIKKNKEEYFPFYKKYGAFWRSIEDEIEYCFYTRFSWIARYILASKKLLENNFNIVVGMGDAIPTRRSLVFAAKKSEIPFLLIQAGATTTQNSGRGFVPLIADKTAVWGEGAKEFLEKFGIDSKKIVITGCMQYDLLENKPSKMDIKNFLDIKENEKVFLLATQPSDEGYFIDKEKRELIKSVINVMENFPSSKLIIKLHPREEDMIHRSIFEELKKEQKDKVRIVRDIDIIELIKISDLFLHVTSTTAIESILLKKPVITVDIFNCRNDMEMFKKFNISEIVKGEKDINKAINRALSEKDNERYKKDREKFLKWSLYKLDGNSCQRVFNLIENMVKK